MRRPGRPACRTSGSKLIDSRCTRPRRLASSVTICCTSANWRSISGQKSGSGHRVYTNVTASVPPAPVGQAARSRRSGRSARRRAPRRPARASRRAGARPAFGERRVPVRSIARDSLRVFDDERRAGSGRPASGPRAARRPCTLNGIVIPGMKPLMSSCLTVISLPRGVDREDLAHGARTPATTARGARAPVPAEQRTCDGQGKPLPRLGAYVSL